MGLFDLFSKKGSPSSEQRELLRLKKMVANKLSQNIDREDALFRLAEMKTPDAAKVLLSRFDWTLNPSIKDQEEKEAAVRGIAAAGEAALPVVRAYCLRAEALAWPLKALKGILPASSLEEELLGILDEFDTEYVRNPQPKVQLLQALGEFTSDDVRIAVQPFLGDTSEEVRFAAATTVLGCDLSAAVESLVSALIDEESLRVKNRIASGLVERGWKIPPSQQPELVAAVPPGFSLNSGALTGAATT